MQMTKVNEFMSPLCFNDFSDWVILIKQTNIKNKSPCSCFDLLAMLS